MRHFDAHAYRTESPDGVWDFARGCMRTYLILREKARALRRGPGDPSGAGRRQGRRTGSADTRRPCGADADAHRRATARRRGERPRRARDPGVRPRASRPTRDGAAARRSVTAAACRVLGVDSSTQATKVEVRDADDGRLLATGRAPHPSTTPPRSEQDPKAWWAALVDAVRQTGVARRRGGVGRRAAAGPRRARRDRRGAAPGEALERHRERARGAPMVEQARRRGVGQACGCVPGRVVHDHEARVAGAARARHLCPGRDRCSCRTTGSPSGSPAAS